ncbi:MAG: helix-turn-helix transcriptional regulator [Rhodothermales bacterium]
MSIETYSHVISSRAGTVASRRRAVEQVIRVMHERLDAMLSLEDMADIAHCSPFHFNRIFRQVAGIPPSQFLYALRLQKAKQLLLTTDLNVTDVCFEVGYNSLGSFTTRFTELVGVTPTQLRRLADEETLYSISKALHQRALLHPAPTTPPSLTGRITTPDELEGPIFIGLFSKPIPQSQPAGGTLILTPGFFQIPYVPPGRYFVMATGLAWPDHPAGFLLPDESLLRVGMKRHPVLLRDGLYTDPVSVTLRPLSLTDPPILIALPVLIARYLSTIEPERVGVF